MMISYRRPWYSLCNQNTFRCALHEELRFGTLLSKVLNNTQPAVMQHQFVRRYSDHPTSLRSRGSIFQYYLNKLCTLVYRCLQGNAPRYLADHLALTSKERLAICEHSHSRSAENVETELTQSQVRVPGTVSPHVPSALCTSSHNL